MVRAREVTRGVVADPVTDLLNRLRNGMRAGHDRVDMPASCTVSRLPLIR